MFNMKRYVPQGSAGKELPVNAGDSGLNPGSGRSHGEGNGEPHQYSCLENSMDRGAWQVQSVELQRVRHNCTCTHTSNVSLSIYVLKNYTVNAAKSLQLCPTLCDPIDNSPPGSSVPGTLQARTLEWVAISFSNACMLSCFSRV